MKMLIDKQLKQELNSINVTDEQKQKLLEKCKKIDNIDDIDNIYNKNSNSFKNKLRIGKFIPISLAASFAIFFIVYTVQNDYFTQKTLDDSIVIEGVTNSITSATLSTGLEMDINEIYIESAIGDAPSYGYNINDHSVLDDNKTSFNSSVDLGILTDSIKDIQKENLDIYTETESTREENDESIYSDNEIIKSTQTANLINDETLKNCNYIGVGSIDFIEENNDIITITSTITTTHSTYDELYENQIIKFDITNEKIQYLDIYNTSNTYIFLLYFENGLYTTDSILEPIILNNYNNIFDNDLLDKINKYILTYW